MAMAVDSRWNLLLLLALCACGPDLAASGAEDTGGTSTTGGEEGTETGDPCVTGTERCKCHPGGTCDAGLVCEDGICVPPLCGNGVLDEGEQCDDGNDVATDDCDMYCNVSGSQEWEVVIDGPVSGGDEAEGVVIDADGDIIVVGYVTVNASTHAHDIWAGKLSGAGKVLWTRTEDGSGLDDRAYAVAGLPGGDFVLAGMTVGTDTNCDVHVARHDSDGLPVWTRTYDGADSKCDAAFGVAASASAQILVVGHENAEDGTSHAWMRAYTGGGDTGWTRTWGEDLGLVVIDHAAAWLPNGDFVVAGLTEGKAGDEIDRKRVLQRRTGDGQLLWALDDVALGNTVIYGVADDMAGGIVGAGGIGTDAWLWRWEDGPSESWAAEHPEPVAPGGYDLGARVGEAVAVDSAGNVVMVGRVTDGDMFGAGQDVLIAKHDPSGERLWVKQYDGPAHTHDRAHAVAIDAEDHIIVAGMTTVDEGEGDIWVAKYGP